MGDWNRDVGVAVLTFQSASQAPLAAGAEVFIGVPLPSPYTIPNPAQQAGSFAQVALCSVIANDAPNAALVATMNLNSSGNPTFQVRVRNIGSAISGNWAVNIMLFQKGGAIGI
ncbi:MAG: hypothetical protein RB191_11355 [Terriglobia bacterium]|nr:hypothetical protein [Terriglobia bacterium]